MELSKVDSNLLQLSDILPLFHHYQPTTTSSATTNTQQQLRILNLHSNHIKSIDAKVTKFLPHLTILDLSSNDIERIDGLELLQSLKSLNLSNNKIRQITGLSALTKLQRLYLSYNLIEKLAGLVHLHGNHHNLELIDLKGNEIKDIKEIYYLVGLTKLKHLILNDDIKESSKNIDTCITRINPICNDPTYRAQIWSICPQISSLDCTDAGGRKIKLDDAAFQFSELTSDLSNFLSESFTVSSQIPHPSLQPNQPNFDNSIYQTYTPQQTQNQYLQSDRLTRIEEEIKSLAVTLSTQRHQQNPSTQAMQNATSTSNEKDSAIIVGPNESIQLNMLQEQMRQLLQMQSEIMKLRKQNGETEKVFGKGVKNDEEIESDETNEDNVEHFNRWRKEKLQKFKKEGGVGKSGIPLAKGGKSNKNFMTNNSNSRVAPSTKQRPKIAVPSSLRSPRKNGAPQVSMSSSKDSSTSSDASDDSTPAAILAQIPKASSTNRVLTWQSAPSHNPSTLPPTNQVIHSLEMELSRIKKSEEDWTRERKIIDDRYAEEKRRRIALENKLQQAEKEFNAKDKLIDELKNKVENGNSIIEKLKAEVKCQEQNKSGQITGATEILELQIKKREDEINAYRKNISELESTVTNLESKLRAVEEEKSKLSLKFLKERESFRIKSIENGTQVEALKTTLEKLSTENTRLCETVKESEHMWKEKLEEVLSAQATTIHQAIKETCDKLESQYAPVIDELEDKLKRTKQAYEALEDEFRKAGQEEQRKSGALENAFKELSQTSSIQKQNLALAAKKEQEQQSLIRELTLVVKDQKQKLEELSDKNHGVILVYEDKLRSLETKIKQLTKFKNDYKQSKKECDQLNHKITEKKAEIKASKNEVKAITEKLNTQTLQVSEEKVKLECRVQNLEEERDKLVKELERESDIVKVKIKMLDDQNETIRNLKSNLQAKANEHRSLVDSTTKIREDLEDKLDQEVSKTKELLSELDRQEDMITKLETLVQEYRNERNQARNQVVELTTKLTEREESIKLIENEVAKVKDMFKTNEQKLFGSLQTDLKTKEIIIEELKSALESTHKTLTTLQQTHTSTLSSLSRSTVQLESTKKENEKLHSEIQFLLQELEIQKRRMEGKWERVRGFLLDDDGDDGNDDHEEVVVENDKGKGKVKVGMGRDQNRDVKNSNLKAGGIVGVGRKKKSEV